MLLQDSMQIVSRFTVGTNGQGRIYSLCCIGFASTLLLSGFAMAKPVMPIDESLQPAGDLPSSSEDALENEFDRQDATRPAAKEKVKITRKVPSQTVQKEVRSVPPKVSALKKAKEFLGLPGPKGNDKVAAPFAHGDVEDDKWESYSDLPPVSSVAEEITGGIRVEDIVEPPSDYSFASFGRSDPFVPPLITKEIAAQQKQVPVDPLEIPIVSPLQQYSLSQLHIVGIWQLESGERKAMVMASGSQNQGIVVKSGDPIGNRGGKIIAIGNEFVMVREFLLAPDGTRQFQDQQMLMNSNEKLEVKGKIVFKPGATQTSLQLEGQSALEGNGLTPNGITGNERPSKDQPAGMIFDFPNSGGAAGLAIPRSPFATLGQTPANPAVGAGLGGPNINPNLALGMPTTGASVPNAAVPAPAQAPAFLPQSSANGPTSAPPGTTSAGSTPASEAAKAPDAKTSGKAKAPVVYPAGVVPP